MCRAVVSRATLCALLVVMFWAGGVGSTHAGGAPRADWFRALPSLGAAFTVTHHPGDPHEVTVSPARAQTGRPVRRILVIYPRASSAYDIAFATVAGDLEGAGLNVSFTVVNFGEDKARGEAAIARAEADGYDLILAMGSPSTDFLWRHYRGGRLPVVSVCAKDPVLLGQAAGYDQPSGTNFAFTSLNIPIDVQMAYLATVAPRLRTIAILADRTNVSAMETQLRPMAEAARARGLSVVEVTIDGAAGARESLASGVAAAVARMRATDPDPATGLFWITGSTAVFREMATINAHAGGFPVFSAVPDVVREGDDSAVLSIGVGFESNARVAARYVASVLSGRVRAGALKVGLVSPPDIAINFREARRIGVRVPFAVFEAAGTVFDAEGRLVREDGRRVAAGRR